MGDDVSKGHLAVVRTIHGTVNVGVSDPELALANDDVPLWDRTLRTHSINGRREVLIQCGHRDTAAYPKLAMPHHYSHSHLFCL